MDIYPPPPPPTSATAPSPAIIIALCTSGVHFRVVMLCYRGKVERKKRKEKKKKKKEKSSKHVRVYIPYLDVGFAGFTSGATTVPPPSPGRRVPGQAVVFETRGAAAGGM